MRVRNLTVLDDADESDLGQFDVFVLDTNVVSLIVCGVRSVSVVLALELGKTYGFIAEEVLIGCLKINLRVRKRKIVNLVQPFVFLFVVAVCSRLVFLERGFVVFVFLVQCNPIGKHLIIEEADGTKRFCKICALLDVWI